MISKETITFLKELADNNNKEWFADNKKRYESGKAEFIELMDGLITNISKFDPSVKDVEAKKSVFRIYRDVRFSKDKIPYQTYIGGHIIGGGGRKNEHGRAGYYVRIEPNKSVLAGGAYLPPTPWITAIRKEIDYNAADLKKIINGKDFKKYFGEIKGEKLKNVPRGFDKEHPEAELLKFKTFLATHEPIADKIVADKNFVNYSTDVFKALAPFDAFLNRGLQKSS